MNISKKAKVTIWMAAIILALAPAVINLFIPEEFEVIWLIQLISIYLIASYFTYLSSVIMSFISIGVHMYFEISEYVDQSVFHSHDYQMFVMLTAVKIFYAISEVYQKKNVQRKQFKLEYLNKELKGKNQEFQKIDFYDLLTGLPNRRMLNKYLEKELLQHSQNKQQLAVLFLNLGRFQLVNDELGYHAGDLLLQQVGQRLISAAGQNGFVARQGGDEFVLILENTNKEQILKVKDHILCEFTVPFIFNQKKYFITPRLGISMYPGDSQKVETLIKHADTAMYVAKESSSINYSFYTSAHEDVLNRKLKLRNDLQFAIQNKELHVYYQPKVNLNTRGIIGMEALLRWEHPELGSISPAEFIPLAEESGLIVTLGKWVLKAACEQNRKWQNSGFPLMKMAVNVSIYQFEDKRFIKDIKEIVSETEMDPQFLELEITESIIQNVKKVLPIVKELKQLGVKVSIDDFGTGYSSLSVLNQLPIDYLKIDQSFVKEALSNSCISVILKTTIQMGYNLKFDLIAEGIETEQQAAFLLENGCQIGQGYLFSKPLPPNKIDELLGVSHNQLREKHIF
ncbi:putative bifunctional diguanylate cyclase/phosphodiesterase [Domibacillus robiginosus]|uniref:putative bifunctional diguanylate cyclase/phosphodiesterase n=1 Tax=Domibacillus robiginosus TaxID=1071054 RepID=UPI00067DA68E|nr:bifunctional diguanylate cyclase/phosphodiesterase [Domibacillus robiginosus]